MEKHLYFLLVSQTQRLFEKERQTQTQRLIEKVMLQQMVSMKFQRRRPHKDFGHYSFLLKSNHTLHRTRLEMNFQMGFLWYKHGIHILRRQYWPKLVVCNDHILDQIDKLLFESLDQESSIAFLQPSRCWQKLTKM